MRARLTRSTPGNAQIERRFGVGREARQRIVVITVIGVKRLREARAVFSSPDNPHEPLRFRHGQQSDHYFVHDAENRCVRANAERQRDDGYQREAGLFQQHSRAVAQVLPKGLHKPSPVLSVVGWAARDDAA
jgi:hypothetical protein